MSTKCLPPEARKQLKDIIEAVIKVIKKER